MGINLSFSAAQKYLLSPFMWYAYYSLRLRPIERPSALVFGGALDEGLNSLLKAVMEHRTPSLELAKEVFKSALETQDGEDMRLLGAIKYSKADLDLSLLKDADQPKEHDLAWYSLLAKGEIMIEEYYNQVIPILESVLAVQLPISLKNESGDEFIGVVDFIAKIGGKTYLVDNKTSSVKYKDDSASDSAQLATYYEACRDQFQLDGVAYITISKKILKKKVPRVNIELIVGSIQDHLIEKTFQDYDDVLIGVKTGKFECSKNCCKQPWPCVYKSFCDSNGQDLSGLKYQEKRK